MKTHDHENAHAAQSRAVAQQTEPGEAATFDHRLNHSSRLVAQRQRLGAAFGPALQQPVQREAGLDDEKPAVRVKQEVPAEANLTGMSSQLKSGIEALSGMDMPDVRVHRNSDKPAQLNALAYAPVIQMVNAYRIEYQHNRKVATGPKGGVTGITAPIDISFVMPDHSDYFAAERSPDQLTGLRRVSWEMDDDWWEAAQYAAKKGSRPKGKAAAIYEQVKALGDPSWSDGASIVKFIKQTALHFNAKWDDSLNGAIKKGSGAVEDLEAEIRAEQKARWIAKLTDEEMVTIRDGGGDEMDVSYGDFTADWEAQGWELVPPD